MKNVDAQITIDISAKMNVWQPWQLKKSKSCESFWSYQQNSTANSAQLAKYSVFKVIDSGGHTEIVYDTGSYFAMSLVNFLALKLIKHVIGGYS